MNGTDPKPLHVCLNTLLLGLFCLLAGLFVFQFFFSLAFPCFLLRGDLLVVGFGFWGRNRKVWRARERATDQKFV